MSVVDEQADDASLLQQAGCYGSQWDPYDSICTVQCGFQLRCLHFISTKKFDEISGVLGMTPEQLHAVPDAELVQHFNTEARPEVIEYIKRYNANPKVGLPVLQEDGTTLLPSGEGPPTLPPSTPEESMIQEAQQALDQLEEEDDEVLVQDDDEYVIQDPDEQEDDEDPEETSPEEDAEEEVMQTKKVQKKKATKQKKATKKAAKVKPPRKKKVAAKKAPAKKKAAKKKLPSKKKAPAKKKAATKKKVQKKTKPTKKKTLRKTPKKSQGWGEETYAKRFEKERSRYKKLQEMKPKQSVTTTYKKKDYKATMLKDGWQFEGEWYPTLYAIQLKIQGGGTEYAGQQNEDGKRPESTRKMSTMSVNRFWGLTK